MISSVCASSKLALGVALVACPGSLLAQETALSPALSADAVEKLNAATFSLAAMEAGSLETTSEIALADEGDNSGDDSSDNSGEGAQDETGAKKRPSWPKLELPKIV